MKAFTLSLHRDRHRGHRRAHPRPRPPGGARPRQGAHGPPGRAARRRRARRSTRSPTATASWSSPRATCCTRSRRSPAPGWPSCSGASRSCRRRTRPPTGGSSSATRIDPATFVMVGNSVRSDVLPVLALGGRAVHIPYHVTWALEHAEPDPERPRLPRARHHRPTSPPASRRWTPVADADARAHDRVVQHPLGTRAQRDGLPAVRRGRRLPPARRRRARAPGDVGARRRRRPSTTQVAAALGMRGASRCRWPGPTSSRSPCAAVSRADTGDARQGDRRLVPGRSCPACRSAPPASSPLPQLRLDPLDRAVLSAPRSTSTARALAVAATHLRHLEFGAPLQTRRLRRALPPVDRPAVFIGDMNMWGWTIDGHGARRVAARRARARRGRPADPRTRSTTCS